MIDTGNSRLHPPFIPAGSLPADLRPSFSERLRTYGKPGGRANSLSQRARIGASHAVGKVEGGAAMVKISCTLDRRPRRDRAARRRCAGRGGNPLRPAFGRLAHQVTDATCFESPDLTTTTRGGPRPLTTLPAQPAARAFTPRTDRDVISPSPPNRTPITKAVPGVQLDARIADDPAGEARILLRLPNDWNGKLVVAGASGTRSEFNGDFAWSDYVVQKGYAYVSQNKGILNLS